MGDFWDDRYKLAYPAKYPRSPMTDLHQFFIGDDKSDILFVVAQGYCYGNQLILMT